MKLPWIVGGFAVVCFCSFLLARQGVLIAVDGKRYEGNITDTGTGYEVVSPDSRRGGGAMNHAVFPKGAVKDIIYADSVADQIKQEEGKLGPSDVVGRIDLAKWAMQNGAWDAAHDVLEDAKKIDPNNHDVDALMTTVNARVPKAAPATQPMAGPATQPVSSLPPKRQVTLDEVNRIRQLEWNHKDPINIRIDGDVRQKFLAGTGIPSADFQRLPREQQAIQILDNGKQDLAAGVHVLVDPASMMDFRKLQRQIFISPTGCGAANCHTGNTPKGGNFYLFSADTPQAMYTNFLTMQTFSKSVSNVQRMLIDREHPDGSLLLQYMLPPDVAETPHPAAQNYHGVVKTKNDVRFQQVSNWIQSLNPILPNYGIDLQQDAPKKEGAPAAK